MRELLRGDVGRELAVVDRSFGLAERGRFGEVVRQRGDVAVVAGAAELFEPASREPVQPHALAHGNGLEEGVAHHPVREAVAQGRARQLDEIARVNGLRESVEQPLVAAVAVGREQP